MELVLGHDHPDGSCAGCFEIFGTFTPLTEHMVESLRGMLMGASERRGWLGIRHTGLKWDGETWRIRFEESA